MHSQETAPSAIEQEKNWIAALTGVENQDTIVLNDSGWDSRVYIINGGELAFKFPRSEVVKQQYQHEIAVCKCLENMESDILVPHVLWQHPAHAYFGYAGIVGVALDQLPADLDRQAKAKMGQHLGDFLRDLHKIRLDGLPTITVEDEIQEYQQKYALAWPVITQEFSAHEQAALRQLILEDVPNALTAAGQDLVLCHGDLGYWNIIYTPDGSVGVIDFGDVGYYDRSKDFIGLEEGVALEAALRIYGQDAGLRQKITLRRKVLAILDLPYYMGKGNQAGIQKTITKIRESLL